jgi:hypothetical protein
MIRKLSVLLTIALLGFAVVACGPKSSSNSSAGAAGTAAATVSASPGTCPTANTEVFAKTRFVADAALAGGAFKRYIYSPARDGKLSKGAHGRVLALIKAVAAGAFVINRLHAAEVAAQSNPTLCKLLVAPAARFESAVSGLINKAKGGAINAAQVGDPSSLLNDIHSAASQGGAAFTDNTSASVG